MEKLSEEIRRKREANLGDDASSLTHYLGNDDYKKGNKVARNEDGDSELDGHEAHGNDLEEEDIEDS